MGSKKHEKANSCDLRDESSFVIPMGGGPLPSHNFFVVPRANAVASYHGIPGAYVLDLDAMLRIAHEPVTQEPRNLVILATLWVIIKELYDPHTSSEAVHPRPRWPVNGPKCDTVWRRHGLDAPNQWTT